MSALSWPASLPPRPLRDGYSEEMANNLLRSPMDAGPAKVRRRSVAGTATVTAVLRLSWEQRQALRVFYADTLRDGALPFLWAPAGTEHLFRFAAPPSLAPAGSRWNANLKLEILP